MKRVLILSRTLPWHGRGGLEEHAWGLARALMRLGSTVTILSTSFTGREHQEERDGVRVVYLDHLPTDHERIAWWRRWRRFARACEAWFDQENANFDLIVSEMVHGRRLFRHPRSQQGVRCYVMHGSGLQDYLLATREKLRNEVGRFHPRVLGQWLVVNWQAWKDRRALAQGDWVLPVSPFVARFLKEHYQVAPSRCIVVPNGVEPPRQMPDRARARSSLGLHDAPWVLFLGRLEPAKGLLALMEHVDRSPDLGLLVAGDGPLQAAVKFLADRNPRIRYFGRVTDEEKWTLLEAADALVLPSQSEGLPITILEALAMGTPVATSGDWVPDAGRQAVVVSQDIAAAIPQAIALRPTAAQQVAAFRAATTWEEVGRRFLGLGVGP